jgi:hypothetical protein
MSPKGVYFCTLQFRVVDPDPDWIRVQSGLWIRIRIQEGKNDPQK